MCGHLLDVVHQLRAIFAWPNHVRFRVAGHTRPSRHGARLLAALAVCLLALTTSRDAAAQRTGIRAQPRTYVTYNNVVPRYDARAEEMNLKPNNPPTSTYDAIATPPPAQFSFVQTSDGENILSALRSNTNGKLLDTLPGAPAAGKNRTFGGLVAARAWNAADVTMSQCFSGGFAWNIHGSLQPSGGGAGVQNTIPYTFASAANFNELSWVVQQPFVNAPPNGANATTAIGDFTQGHAWSDWNTLVLPLNNSTGRYRAYEVSIEGGITGGVRHGGDPFVANNKTVDWGNTDQFSLANKAFESPIFASPDALGGAGAANPAGPNNGRTMTQAAAHPTWAVLVAFSATNDNRFVLNLERQYVALRSDGIPANHIAVLYGDGTVVQLGSFPNIVAANRQPNFGNIYTAGFTMPVSGGASLANVRTLLAGTGWVALGLVAPPAGANLYLYVTGHGGAVNVGGVPIATNQAGNTVITTMTLDGPPNPAPTTKLQIASNSPMPPAVLSRILAATVLVDGNQLPGNLAVESAPWDVSSFIPTSPGSLFYYSISVPQPYFSLDGNGTYTLGLKETGSFASSDLATFMNSVVAVTTITDVQDDPDDQARLSNNVDTYTNLVSPQQECMTPQNCDDDDPATCDNCVPNPNSPTGAFVCDNQFLCDDDNPCTDDTCGSAGGGFVCSHENKPNPCEDGDSCTTNDVCVNGGCVGTPDLTTCHFQCYEVKPAAFVNPPVSLEDRFTSVGAAVMRFPHRLCAPADKNGEDPFAPTRPDHLEGYDIRGPVVRLRKQKTVDQFGSLFLDVVSLDRLFVPTAKSLTGPLPPLVSPAIDHFDCYKVRKSSGTARFTPRTVTVEDQLGSATETLKKPFRLCVPTNKNDEAADAAQHPVNLLCYKVAERSFPTLGVFTNNQFGPGTPTLIHRRELCVPALLNPACGNGVVEPSEQCDPPMPNSPFCPTSSPMGAFVTCQADCTCAP